MDGSTLLRELRGVLQEGASSGFMDDRMSYRFLYDSAIEIAARTNAFTTTQSITTVADTSSYNLNPDFLQLYLMDDENRHYLKYNDGTNDNFIFFREYQAIIYSNNTTSQSIPSSFSITDASAGSRVTGTATSAGDASNGECTLTDSAADFSDVHAGDYVHNTTDGSHGVVVSKTSTTALVTALFDGTGNDWDTSDAYFVIPQGRHKLIIDPPSSTASHTITFYYAKKPDPVFSPYRFYPFAPNYLPALVKYAAWLYKYSDREPNYGDAWYRYFDLETRKYATAVNGARQRKGFRVNMKKTAHQSGSYR